MPGKPPTGCKGVGGNEPFSFRRMWRDFFGDPYAGVRDWDNPRPPHGWSVDHPSLLCNGPSDEVEDVEQAIRLSDLSRLDVRPGDVLVYRSNGMRARAGAPDPAADLAAALPPGVKLLLIPCGAEIAVIRRAGGVYHACGQCAGTGIGGPETEGQCERCRGQGRIREAA